ncbi:dicarboxylate/amino acid:cation symporter [Halocatena pleomorpha]|uniref:Dicarboxylate/amino acid:cation symporter n=1 Tax=Halocatena pleomorpha TaxID=1785090 RepID=A0A3P3R9S6_9EURY|nr:dicarboxylate/amino acid:cation symporter [Halocatena pleomorpha]RRJ30232.1 dicarboxylate/amino acid:cation symporter [Halocatena pleomorpha]
MATTISQAWQRYRSVQLVYRIAVAFVLGSIVGLLVGQRATVLQPLGDLFVRLLKMIIVPIVVFTIVMASRQLSPSNLGKIGSQVVVVYLLTTAIAIGVGLLVSNLLDPGVGLQLTDGSVSPEDAPPLLDVLLGVVPENPIGAMAEGNILGVITFSLVFGIGMTTVREEVEEGSDVYNGIETLFNVIEAGAEVMFKVVWGVMEYGVIGVFALMAALFGQTGAGAIVDLLMLVVTLTAAVGIQIGVVYLLFIVTLLLGQSPLAFLRGCKDAMVTALSIRSSTGTLPVTMSNADDNLQINEGIYSFSLPLGATINMDGTAMYLGIAAIFTANIVDVHLTIAQQLSILLTALLASVGTAGVPGASLVMMSVVFSQVGLPLSAVAMIAGIDPLLDRLRTMNNITGDLAVTALVAKWNDAIDLSSGAWDS